MAVVETRRGKEEKQTETAPEGLSCWDIGPNATRVLPEVLRPIVTEVETWFNPKHGWKIARLTAQAYGEDGKSHINFIPLLDGKIENLPHPLVLGLQIRASNPPSQRSFLYVSEADDLMNIVREQYRHKWTKNAYDFITFSGRGIGDIYTQEDALEQLADRFYLIRFVIGKTADSVGGTFLSSTEETTKLWPEYAYIKIVLGSSYALLTKKIASLQDEIVDLKRDFNPTEEMPQTPNEQSNAPEYTQRRGEY